MKGVRNTPYRKRKAADLFKLLNSAIERTSRKINNRRLELLKSENREEIRIYAELITANQYRLTEKASVYRLENYYDNNNLIRIKADPALTPTANSQKYFKEYRKAKTAEKMLTELIEKNKEELEYLGEIIADLTKDRMVVKGILEDLNQTLVCSKELAIIIRTIDNNFILPPLCFPV